MKDGRGDVNSGFGTGIISSLDVPSPFLTLSPMELFHNVHRLCFSLPAAAAPDAFFCITFSSFSTLVLAFTIRRMLAKVLKNLLDAPILLHHTQAHSTPSSPLLLVTCTSSSSSRKMRLKLTSEQKPPPQTPRVYATPTKTQNSKKCTTQAPSSTEWTTRAQVNKLKV